jgi:3-methyladenine DNA glycosylase AlkD
MKASTAIDELMKKANRAQAESSRRFFKNAPGGYGEGLQVVGVRVPQIRLLVKKYRTLEHDEVIELVEHTIHEVRMMGLLIWVAQMRKADDDIQEQILKDYLQRSEFCCSWDLVDCSAPGIVGEYYLKRPRAKLLKLAKSKSLWERRIAMVSTWQLIKKRDLETAIEIAKMLLKDDEDLIHKAVGWMLRELGKRDEGLLRTFLDDHASLMPRTALRYAIERLPDRAQYLEIPQQKARK